MRAIEAREKALSVINDSIRYQLKEIYTRIIDAVGRGEFKTYYYEYLLEGVKKKLQEDGYSVEECDLRNEVTITISW